MECVPKKENEYKVAEQKVKNFRLQIIKSEGEK